MPRYLVVLTTEIEVEADEADYAEEVALTLVDTNDLYAEHIEEVGA